MCVFSLDLALIVIINQKTVNLSHSSSGSRSVSLVDMFDSVMSSGMSSAEASFPASLSVSWIVCAASSS